MFFNPFGTVAGGLLNATRITSSTGKFVSNVGLLRVGMGSLKIK